MGYLLGIDAGTTMVKAALFDEEKGAVAHTEVDCTLSFSDEKCAEIDMEIYWDACKHCIHNFSTIEHISLSDISALSISSQGVTFVPIDRQGKQLRRGIFVYDTRAVSEARELVERFGEKEIFEITGQPAVTAQFEVPKLMWLRKHEPECFNNIYKILLVQDYLVFKLTGKCICVKPIISSSLLFDLKRKCWWAELLEFIDLPEERLPDIYNPGDVVSPISADASRETGISAKAVVVAGAIDQVSGMLGVGNTASGIISESTGSVLAVHTVSDRIFAQQDAGIHSFCNAIANTYALISICPSAGATLNWFKDVFCDSEMEDASKTGINVFELILNGVSDIPAGSDGLVMLPYLSGRGSPKPNMSVKGLFFNIRFDHRKAHFVRALLESVAYMLKSNIEIFKKYGLYANEIRSFGGGSKSELWNRIKADVCSLPVLTSRFQEPGCMGAAILAGAGSGIFENIDEGCKQLVCLNEPVYPNEKNNEIYEEYFEKYTRLDETIEPLF